ncbi:MAG: outer membrane lipoprotein carrier protein LolA [Alphaproteobacteria bacterium]|nr:outer membrane lipoprotein carrier protein LolA [Alphaproteobacteria bacterium]
MRTLLSLLLFALLAAPGAAPDLPPDAVAAWTEMAQVQSLEARFVQVRHSKLLSKPIESTGTLRFARPDKMAWAVETPARSTFVMDGTLVGMAFPDLGVREEIDLEGNPEVARLVAGMMIWLAGDADQIARDYAVTWTAGSPALAVLEPRSKELAAIIARLELHIGGSPLTVQSVTIHEPDGDRVEIRLSDVSFNPTLPDGAFTLPAGG